MKAIKKVSKKSRASMMNWRKRGVAGSMKRMENILSKSTELPPEVLAYVETARIALAGALRHWPSHIKED